ncbi:hypothetical protein [Streptomyces sp. NBC_00503]|uniref:hypothetical protein n=1 Tax=Streptomyces sp. NBC_00503 TaxID=2903659 RepID=UPI002E81544C|nr:hypothetical protein [Streptomyces sp. NBC_00503]WUD79620.1 hypothetical protein OG490_02960 [Streptomyces sp. NBC_00503]
MARRVVIDLAPREARHFEQRARAHFRPRLPWRGRRTTRFDLLGLPSELLTPTALAVSTALLGAVSTELVAGLRQRTTGLLRRRGQHRAEPASAGTPSQPPPTAAGSEPTAADLARWHTSALEAARECRVPEELARRIADSALAHLVQYLAARSLPVAAGDTARDALPPESANPNPAESANPNPAGPNPSPPDPPVADGPPAADR